MVIPQESVDARVQEFYSREFDESARLTTFSAAGVVEFLRVQTLIAARISPGSRILDIGGGTGIHAAELARLGHSVELTDPVPLHVETALAYGTFGARIGDARTLGFADNSFDAALSFGPLYHLASYADRVRSLSEAVRVLRPGGIVFAAAMPRLARLAALTLGELVESPYPSALVALLESGAADPDVRFPAGHFHTAGELREELEEAGIQDVFVTGIEGPAGLTLSELEFSDQTAIAAAITLAELADGVPEVSDLSDHLIAIGRVQ